MLYVSCTIFFLLALSITFNEIPTIIPVEPVHDVNPIFQKDHMLKFNCKVNIPNHARNYLFDVKWSIDGKQMKVEQNLNMPALQQNGLLTRDEWIHKLPKRLGFKVFFVYLFASLFVLFLLAIVLSVILRFMDSD